MCYIHQILHPQLVQWNTSPVMYPCYSHDFPCPGCKYDSLFILVMTGCFVVTSVPSKFSELVSSLQRLATQIHINAHNQYQNKSRSSDAHWPSKRTLPLFSATPSSTI